MSKIIEFFTLDPSDPLRFWAQIVGFIPLVLSLITFALTKRKHILVSKTLSDFTSAIHFFLLGEIVGGMVCVINTARGTIFYQRGKAKWASHIVIPIIFCVATLATSFIRWNGAISLLPTCGSVLAVIGFWFNNPRYIKLFNLPAITLWLIYSILIGSISTTLINAFSIITILVSMVIDLIKSARLKKAKANETAPDTPDATDSQKETSESTPE